MSPKYLTTRLVRPMITLPTTSLGTLKKFLTTHRDLMFRYIVTEISKGVETKSDRVDLFKFGETSYIAACRQDEYGMMLEQALSFFIEKEMYEDAAKCRDLLTKVKVEDTIRKSQLD